MASSIELCAPCQRAFRTGRFHTIAGPYTPLRVSDPYRSSSKATPWEDPFPWECALCVAIADIGGRRRLSADNLISRLRFQIARRFVQDRHEHQALRLNQNIGPPSPPVGSLADISLVSTRLWPSQHCFRSKDAAKLLHPKQSYLRIVPELKIDTTLVKRWLDHCGKLHDVCRELPPVSGMRLLLIDVRRYCLVSVCHARYFALSYVWGDASQLQLKQADLQRLQTPGALQKLWDEMSPVVTSAMMFVKQLGETFLWVDTLCIIQDSPGRQAYLSRMNEVYSGAVCTLIAMEGQSAMSSLPGVQPKSRKLNYLHVSANISIVRRRSDLASACVASKYESRAWTFQERILSRRCLYFTHEQLYFQCSQAIWSEDRYEMHQQDFGTDRAFPSIHDLGRHLDSSWTSKYRTFIDLVEQYTQKEMSYTEDRLNAFSGVISNLAEEWDWQFVAGLPVAILDLALLWTHTTSARQRVRSDDLANYLPSWSWAGWTHGTDYYILPKVSKVSRQALVSLGQVVPHITQIGITANGKVIDFRVSAQRVSLPEMAVAHSSKTYAHEDDAGCDATDTPYSISPDLSNINNLLIFKADTVVGSRLVTFEASQMVNGISRTRYSRKLRDVPHYRLRRIQGQQGQAGILFLSDAQIKPRLTDDFLFILVSQVPGLPCVTALANLHGDEDDCETDDNVYRGYFDTKKKRLEPVVTCNILLVKTNERGVYERVAVGQIHALAWLEAEPLQREIILG